MADFSGVTIVTVTIPSEEHDRDYLESAVQSAVNTALWDDRYGENIGDFEVVSTWEVGD